MSTAQSIFRITFVNDESIYEIYAKKVTESDMFGFLLVEEFLFGEQSSIVVDPSEEKLKLEFNTVKRTYIPAHSIIRIDEVEREGTPKMRETSKDSTGKSNISVFPKSPIKVTE